MTPDLYPGAGRSEARRARAAVRVAVGVVALVLVGVAIAVAPRLLRSTLSSGGIFAALPSVVVVEIEADSTKRAAQLIDLLDDTLRANFGPGVSANGTSNYSATAGLFFTEHRAIAQQYRLRDDGSLPQGAALLDFDAFVEDANVVVPGLLAEAPPGSTAVTVRFGLPDGTGVLVARLEQVDGAVRFVPSRTDAPPTR